MNAALGHFSIYLASITTVGILTLLVGKAAPIIIARETAKKRNISDITACVLKRTFYSSAIGALFSVSFFLIGNRIYGYVIASSILFFIGSILVEITSAVLRGAGYFNRQLINLLLASLIALAAMFFLGKEIQAHQIITIFGISNVLAAILNYIYMRHVPTYSDQNISSDSSGLFFTSLLTHLFFSIDKIIAPLLLPVGASELYAKVVVLVGRPIQIIGQTAEQYLVTLFSKNRNSKLIRVLMKLSLFLFGVSIFGAIAGTFSPIYFSDRYSEIVPIVAFVFSAYILWPIYSMLGARIWSLGKSTYPRIYVNYFSLIGGIILLTGVTMAAYFESVYILALTMMMIHIVRAALVFYLNKRLGLAFG